MRGKERGFRLIAIFLAFAMVVEMAGMHLGTAVFATEAESAVTVVSENTTEVSVETDIETEAQVDGNSPEEATEQQSQPQEDISAETQEPVAEQAEIEKATIELTCTDFSSAGVRLAWTAEEVSGLASFEVYRDGVKIGTVEVTEETEYAYTDADVEQNKTYTYQVYGIDSQNAQVQRSESVLIEVVDDWTVNSNYTLTENKVVKNLIVTGGTLDLSNCELIVLGDVRMTNGVININKGYLKCENYSSGNYGRIYMNDANSYMWVKGQFSINNLRSEFQLTDGTLEIGGDFIGTPNNNRVFYAEGNHITKLTGDKKQTLSFNGTNNCFNILELENTSDEGIYCDGAIYARVINTKGCNIDLNVEKGQVGWLLEENMIYEGDLVLMAGELDLNGYTLSVTGDLIQVGGMVNVNGGVLDVKGNYYIENKKNIDGTNVFSQSASYLKMINEKDHVIVEKDFFDHMLIMLN